MACTSQSKGGQREGGRRDIVNVLNHCRQHPGHLTCTLRRRGGRGMRKLVALPPPPHLLHPFLAAIVMVLLPHLAGAAILVAATQSLCIPMFPTPYLLCAITCWLLGAPYLFLCGLLSLHWWLLPTLLFLLPPCSSKRRSILLTWRVLFPFCAYQGTMPLGKREAIQAIPNSLQYVQLRGSALHSPEGW